MNTRLKAVAAAALFLSSTGSMAASVADIAFVVDQSGSMSGEFSWIASSISTISQKIADAGITARYAISGYERTFGTAYSGNIYSDFTSDINDIITTASGVSLYGGSEYSYNAAVAATTGFSWDQSAAKVIILITDEASPQYGDIYTEQQVGDTMNAGGFLLNVIAPETYRTRWDEAAYSNGSYLGFFDLAFLRDDATGFTDQFAAAKITEIVNTPNPVPVPAAVWLFGSGLAGFMTWGRKKKQSVQA